MLTKKAYTLEEVILYLEALEMLDMIYTVQKYPETVDGEGHYSRPVWVIEYTQGEPFGKSSIQFED